MLQLYNFFIFIILGIIVSFVFDISSPERELKREKNTEKDVEPAGMTPEEILSHMLKTSCSG